MIKRRGLAKVIHQLFGRGVSTSGTGSFQNRTILSDLPTPWAWLSADGSSSLDFLNSHCMMGCLEYITVMAFAEVLLPPTESVVRNASVSMGGTPALSLVRPACAGAPAPPLGLHP